MRLSIGAGSRSWWTAAEGSRETWETAWGEGVVGGEKRGREGVDRGKGCRAEEEMVETCAA